MQKFKRILLFIVISLPLICFYSNCSEVDFESSSYGSSGNQNTENPPDMTDDELLDLLPPEERDRFRPITDIIDDPGLRDVFKCPGNDSGVLICHFPSGENKEHTLCVGGNAPISHSKHEISFDDNGNLLELSDYLGPCKHDVIAP